LVTNELPFGTNNLAEYSFVGTMESEDDKRRYSSTDVLLAMTVMRKREGRSKCSVDRKWWGGS
jgi:hypothetical protein